MLFILNFRHVQSILIGTWLQISIEVNEISDQVCLIN